MTGFAFAKLLTGLVLLALFARDVVRNDEGLRHVGGFLWRFAILVGVMIVLALASGYVAWEPKLPPGWPAWLARMVFLTVFPEEAIFRAVLQTRIERRLAPAPSATAAAVVIAAALFGLVHVAGGLVYVVLATIAGIGYGWIFAATRSFAAAMAAHTGLNAVHYFFFTYP